MLVFGGLGAPAAMADPDPDTNKNAVIVTFACGEETVDVVTIRHNAALAVQRVDGNGVLVLVKITLVDADKVSQSAKTKIEAAGGSVNEG